MAGAKTRVLTGRELNRALLARQLLLERRRLAVPRALEMMGGLQAQYAPSMYIGLWSRVDGFERAHLTEALEQRTVVQGTLMRVTIHLVSAEDYWPLAVAVRLSRRKWWRRAARPDLDEAGYEAASAALRERLEEGPVRRPELDELVGKPNAIGIGLWLDMVRVPPSGTWERRRADLFASAEEWLGAKEVDPGRAMEHLVRRYLGGFGPSTPGELADWAGMAVGDVLPTLDRMGPGLRRFRAEDGQELLDLARAPLPDRATPAPVRFLPTWDAALLVHARRKQVIAEEHRPLVFNTKMPQSVGTFLVDGTVGGTWRYRDGKVEVSPFDPLRSAVRREVDDEAARLTAFHA